MRLIERIRERLRLCALRQPPLGCVDFPSAESFEAAFSSELSTTGWKPHPRYSVFTQYDQEIYLERRDAYEMKYRCFNTLTRVLRPSTIIELGTSAGSAADAYLSGAPNATYLGFDLFYPTAHRSTGAPWDPRRIATDLLSMRGFRSFKLYRVDFRRLRALPVKADLIIVDGAHDFYNEYEDLKLALTANPRYLFVDDSDGEEARAAIEKLLRDDLPARVRFVSRLSYIDGGVLIGLRG